MFTGTLIRIFLVGVLLTGVNAGLAQGRQMSNQPRSSSRDQHQRPALPDSSQIVEIVDQTAQALSLTSEQKGQVSDLYFAHFAEARDLMDSGNGQQKNNRAEMDALRQTFETDVKALLNDEQKTSFDELVKDRRPRGGPPGGGRK